MRAPDLTHRLAIYRRLSRLLFPHRYAGKILLLAFAATHVPLLALVGYLVLGSDLGGGEVWRIVGVAVAATVGGTALAFAGLWILLAPVASAAKALTAYRVQGIRPSLPTDLADEGGQLLSSVQQTLLELDAALGRLEDLATHDRVTGLLTRGAGERRLEEALAQARAGGGRLALLALDADGLKGVNDRWGHAAGDCYLRQLAAVLAEQVGPAGWVARWGGDEFVVVLLDAANGIDAATLLQRLQAALAAQPMCLPSGEQVPLRVSGGVAWMRPDDDPAALVARADADLYHAKRSSTPARGRAVGGASPAAEPFGNDGVPAASGTIRPAPRSDPTAPV